LSNGGISNGETRERGYARPRDLADPCQGVVHMLAGTMVAGAPHEVALLNFAWPQVFQQSKARKSPASLVASNPDSIGSPRSRALFSIRTTHGAALGRQKGRAVQLVEHRAAPWRGKPYDLAQSFPYLLGIQVVTAPQPTEEGGFHRCEGGAPQFLGQAVAA